MDTITDNFKLPEIKKSNIWLENWQVIEDKEDTIAILYQTILSWNNVQENVETARIHLDVKKNI